MEQKGNITEEFDYYHMMNSPGSMLEKGIQYYVGKFILIILIMNKMNCHDFIQNLVGNRFKKYNHVGDYLLVTQTLFFLIIYISLYSKTNNNQTIKIVLIFLVLYILRYILRFSTKCKINVNPKRPLLSSDNYWYILSGHLMISLVFTYIVYIQNFSPIVLIFNIIFSVLIFFTQIVTFEHKTVDMIITTILVLLVLNFLS